MGGRKAFVEGGVILGRDTVLGDRVTELDETREAFVGAGDGSSKLSDFLSWFGLSGISLLVGLRMFCIPMGCDGRSSRSLCDLGDLARIAGLGAPILEASLMGGKVLESNGGSVWCLSSVGRLLDSGRGGDGPGCMQVSPLGSVLPRPPLRGSADVGFWLP